MNALALKDKLGVQVLKDLVQELSPTVPKVKPTFLNSRQPSGIGVIDNLTRTLAGFPSETPDEIAKLKSALSYLSADAKRGNGQILDGSGGINDAYWLGTVWAIKSLQWACGEQIAREWSKTITRAPYSEEGFQKAWREFDPKRTNIVTFRSIYKLAALLGWNAPEPKGALLPAEGDRYEPQYRLLGPADIAQLPPIKWRLKGIFPQQGLGAIFGPSASGKSFLAFDLGASISLGDDWFGLKVSQAEVVYVLLEGEAGLKNRFDAWEKARSKQIPSSYRFIVQPVHLMSADDVGALIEVLPRDAVIFIDTLNRAAPTADENSSRDMGVILQAAKQIAAQNNGLVIVVHHTGKDQGRGMRGHSSLFAALDGAIEVVRDASGKRSWGVAKTKDGDDGATRAFKLEVHTLGKDADGEDITSCSVEVDSSNIFLPKKPQGKLQGPALNAIKSQLANSPEKGKCQSGGNTPCVSVDSAITAVANTLTTEAPNKRKHRAKGIVDSLIAGSFLYSGIDAQGEGWVWCV